MISCNAMLGTFLLVKVYHIRWDLVTLLSPSSQRIDSIDEIVFNLCSLKTVTNNLGLSDLGISRTDSHLS